MDKKIGIIIGKVILSLLVFIVGITLGDIIRHSVLGLSRNSPSLSLLFSSALVFPIWHPSHISKRLTAALIGPIVGFGFWCISLALPIESGAGMVLLSGAIRGGAFIVALGAEYLILVSRDGVTKPKRMDKSDEQMASSVVLREEREPSEFEQVSTSALETASSQTNLSQSKSSSPGVVFIRLAVISLIVGVVMSALGLSPYDIINFIKTLAPRIYNMGFDAFEWMILYFLLGATVVFPIWLIAWLIVRIIKKPKKL